MAVCTIARPSALISNFTQSPSAFLKERVIVVARMGMSNSTSTCSLLFKSGFLGSRVVVTSASLAPLDLKISVLLIDTVTGNPSSSGIPFNCTVQPWG